MTPPAITALVEQCADEMVADWADGQMTLAEVYLTRHPELATHADAILELLAEELALREEYRQPISAQDLEARFPQWQPQVRALLECQQLLGGHITPPEFPLPGEALGEFELKAELGRGAHGRVYLALQTQLADRPVVLKVSKNTGTEHLSLARLQHTNIVPLYSAIDFPERRLRALCLPYFGGLTIAEIQARLQNRVPQTLSGRDILETVQSSTIPNTTPITTPITTPVPRRSTAWNYLEQATLPDAICWIGANLADALQYAHNRGILHLDLKASNVLLASDGVPMLLDFHLAHSPIAAGDVPPNWLGGTPHGMSPEHLAAVEAVRNGHRIPAAVDARSDIYSLGLMLRELLDATHSVITPGLSDVLDKCTARNPADRYSHAELLANDFRRHLAHRPLKGVANRSPLERWHKWRRRWAHALPLLIVAVILVIAGIALATHFYRLNQQAQLALDDSHDFFERNEFAQAKEAIHSAEALIAGVPFQSELRADIRRERQEIERAITADTLHAFAEKLRFIEMNEGLQAEELRNVIRECQSVWTRRTEFMQHFSTQKTAERNERWQHDLLDIGLQLASLSVRVAAPADKPDAQKFALQTLDEVEATMGSSPMVEHERLRYSPRQQAALQLATLKTEIQTPESSAWESVIRGRTLLALGELSYAANEFASARRREPQLFWPNFYHGVTLFKLHQPTDAMAAFTACISLAPQAAWCWFNRGLAYAVLERHDAAIADFDQALKLDPTLGVAYLERATALGKVGRLVDAFADLNSAGQAGVSRAEIEYRLAMIHADHNHRDEAEEHVKKCLSLDPAHAAAKQLLQQLSSPR